MSNKIRFHKKRDGWLMIKPNGQGRFLSVWEGFLYGWFGKEPKQV
jgi:hypothetical protein